MKQVPSETATLLPLPRLGFLGVGWIGQQRMSALAASGAAQVTAIADAEPAVARQAARGHSASVARDLDALLETDLDGIVIATPSALHARQALQALERGIPVFCQKPLGRTCAEAKQVIDAARAHDCLLGVDLSYRFVRAAVETRALVLSGNLGRVYAADLTFHNAYGPDKPWFYDATLAGGGCVMDLGIHLVDLLFWCLGSSTVEHVDSRLYARGEILRSTHKVEDYAVAQLQLAGDITARMTCSWHLHAGRDALIRATFYGTNGAACFTNRNGSFYDFAAYELRGTSRGCICDAPDVWGGRALIAWATQLRRARGYSAAVEELLPVASAIDRVYGR